MSDLITGYQYGDNDGFTGVYVFPNNLDKDDIHMPPNTVLNEPPLSELKPGEECAWNGKKWFIRQAVPVVSFSNPVEIPVQPPVVLVETPEPEPVTQVAS